MFFQQDTINKEVQLHADIKTQTRANSSNNRKEWGYIFLEGGR